MTFAREHHRVIAAALGCLDAPALRERRCYFAGGTALAMRFGEDLRTACRGPQGFTALTVPGQRVVAAADIRIDQYGIRARLSVAGVPVKFEIIREGRIALDDPGPGDQVLGVATTTFADLVATKLLANSDRWADPSVFSRDIIDLAMVGPDRRTLTHGLRKARAAYGESVFDDAQSAIASLRDRDRAVERCQHALGMTQPRAVVVDRLRRLSASLTGAWKAM
jgi:hypothetical protein